MEYEKRLETRVWRLAAVMMGLTLISLRGVTGTWASYTTEASSGDTARAAAFVFQVSENGSSQVIDLSEIQKPGDQKIVTFDVSNTSGNVISEVALNYTVDVSLDGSMPIKCTVTKRDASGNTGSGTESPIIAVSNIGTSPVLSGTYGTNTADDTEFSASTEKTDHYTLTAVWPNDQNDAQYANASGQGVIRLTVTGLQKD